MSNDVIFMNITLDLKYESSSDEDEKEERTLVSSEAPLAGMYK